MSAYYTKPTPLAKFVLARAADINDRTDAVEAAFDAVETAMSNKLGSPDAIADLPNAATRAGKALAFDVSGDPTVVPYLAAADVATAVAAAATATTQAGNASSSASAASSSASAASSSASAASSSASSASSSASTATTQANNAAASAVTAGNAQTAAEAAQTAAEAAQTAAELAQTGAQTAKTNAETAETNAETAESLAAEWAEKAEDVAITGHPGQYSALHHSAKAADSATAAAASESAAGTSETNSAANVTYAAEWANKAEDSLVSAAAGGDQVDDYSAMHWANKAAAEVAGIEAEIAAAVNSVTQGLIVSIVTGTSQTGAPSVHYTLTNVSATNVTFPLTPTQGDTFAVTVANGLSTNTLEVTDEDVVIGDTTLTDNDTLTLDNPSCSVAFRFIDSTRGWRLI